MDGERDSASADVIRWTFQAAPEQRAAIETYLTDLGLDVFSRADGTISATWDEPEGDIDEVVEGLWEVAGETFEITHEALRRLDLLIYHPEGDGEANEAADQAA